jgi:hypothetical protein
MPRPLFLEPLEERSLLNGASAIPPGLLRLETALAAVERAISALSEDQVSYDLPPGKGLSKKADLGASPHAERASTEHGEGVGSDARPQSHTTAALPETAQGDGGTGPLASDPAGGDSGAVASPQVADYPQQAVLGDAQHTEALTEYRRENEVAAASALLGALLSRLGERGSEEGPPNMRTVPERDEAGATTRLDHVFVAVATGAQPGLLVSPWAEAVDPFGAAEAPHGLAETAGPGPLSDTLFLDGWREGLPPPRADLVPAARGGLTIVPAYLVGPVAPQRADEPVPARETGPGLTDLIVGLQEQRPDQADHRTAHAADRAERSVPVPLKADSLPGVVAPDLPWFVVGRRDVGLKETLPVLPEPSADPGEGEGGG